jgi:hypothetical protein
LLGSTAATPVEIWFQDEARVGQKGGHTYVWAELGSRPPMIRDNRHDSAYIFGANSSCPTTKLSARVWDSYEAIVAACAEAWNFFVNDPDRIRTIGIRDWATVNL